MNSSCFKISKYAKSQNDGLYWPKVGYKSLYFANYTETVKKENALYFSILHRENIKFST